jgi:hypothetical protein
VLLRVAYGPGDIGFDSAFSVVWGEQLLQGAAPDYGAAVSPTPHPLANVAGALASLTGDAAFDALIWLSFVSFAGLGVAAFAVGSRAFGSAIAGLVFAAILLTRPLLVTETLQASIDIPFLALVLTALAIELGRERRAVPVLVALGLAGLLRPEAWLLAAAYAAYVLAAPEQRADRGHVLGVVALAASGPVLWMLTDLITTGDLLYSLTGTQDLAERLERERGVGAAVRALPTSLRTILASGVVWSGIAVGLIAVMASERRTRLPLALLVLGLANFLALGLAGLPILTRYAIVPGAAVALFCAAGVAAFAWLRPDGPLRFAGVGVSLAVTATLAVGAVDDREVLRATVDGSRDRRALKDAIVEVADGARAGRLAESCRPLQAAVYTVVPILAYRIGVPPSEIAVLKASRARAGTLFTAPATTLAASLEPGEVVPSEDLRPPPGFTQGRSNRFWTLATRC